MPLYEYQCDACEHRFEKIQKFSDPLVDVCPKCGKGPVRKLLSSPAIQFKGSGFYINDYAKKSSSSESSTSTKSTGTEGAVDTKKSEPAAASTPSEKSSDKKD